MGNNLDHPGLPPPEDEFRAQRSAGRARVTSSPPERATASVVFPLYHPLSASGGNFYAPSHVHQAPPPPLTILQFAPTRPIKLENFAHLLPQNWRKEKNLKNLSYLKPLSPTRHVNFSLISEGVQQKTNNRLRVISVYENRNVYLWLFYSLKKAELECVHESATLVNLFHGTDSENIIPICKKNFDWRRNGTKGKTLYGQGVNFSPLPSYASHYSGQQEDGTSQMIMVNVLLARAIPADPHVYRALPPEGYDATAKPDGKVVVKYDDHSFYPRYVVRYMGSMSSATVPREFRSEAQVRQERLQQEHARLEDAMEMLEGYFTQGRFRMGQLYERVGRLRENVRHWRVLDWEVQEFYLSHYTEEARDIVALIQQRGT